jgi:UDP-N-acetylglucosamine--dolichyl-phosphate N-acetylglucosaminephosphotransferase
MHPLTQLNWGFLEIFYLIIIFLVGFFVTYLTLPYVIKFMKKKEFVGYDIHKNSRPRVAESGGLVIVIGFIVASLFVMIFFQIFLNETIIFLLTVIIAGVIGFIDDRKKLRSRYKILLSIFAGSALFFANIFGFITISSPAIPFLDETRLTVVYPLIIPIIVAVFTNTVNMLEGYNGEGVGTCLIAVSALFVCGILWNSAEAVIFTIPVIAVLIPFFIYNRFPAKIFPGDIGTLSMGAMIACIMFFGSLEVATFVALLTHIFNSFYVIYSARGFFESSDLHEEKSDIILLEDDRIKASSQKDAALTLPRLILARGPLKEPELVKNFFALSAISGFFSIFSIIILQVSIGNFEPITLIFSISILIVPTSLILFKFPRIRGIAILMIILLVSIAIFLIIIQTFIMPLPFEDITIGILIIPINLLISFLLIIPLLITWYILTIKYFWSVVKKMKRRNNQKETHQNF